MPKNENSVIRMISVVVTIEILFQMLILKTLTVCDLWTKVFF